MAKKEVLRYRLPDWMGSYLINGDASSLTDEEKEGIDTFVKDESVTFLQMEDDSSFYKSNDYDGLGSNCSTFLAHKVAKDPKLSRNLKPNPSKYDPNSRIKK